MRTEKKTESPIWTGKLSTKYLGDGSGIEYQIERLGRHTMFAFHGGGSHTHLFCESLPMILNFWRDLGDALNEAQPGLTLPLPDGDPNEVDAMKVIFEADQLQRGTK